MNKRLTGSCTVFFQGNIYLKCLTADVASKIVQSFNGRFFAGRTIRATPVPAANYHTMFADSVNAVRPLKPDPWVFNIQPFIGDLDV